MLVGGVFTRHAFSGLWHSCAAELESIVVLGACSAFSSDPKISAKNYLDECARENAIVMDGNSRQGCKLFIGLISVVAVLFSIALMLIGGIVANSAVMLLDYKACLDREASGDGVHLEPENIV